MNYLITGAAGFLGSALANRLTKEDHLVRGLDDLSSGDRNRLSPDVQFSIGDVNNRSLLWTQLKDIDCVYHLAARVSVPESILYPREYNAVNVGGTVSVMEAMRDVGVKRVVLISSGAVYGTQGEQPLRENAVPNPRSPYAVSKLAAEYYVRTIGSLYGIETVSLRVFNAYGPGQPLPASHPPLIPHFLRQTARGGTLVLHGDGAQTRDFIFIEDVIDAMVAASTAPTVDRQVINIGSGIEHSILNIAQAVIECLEKEAHWIFSEDSDPGPNRMCADMSLAQEKLDFFPRVSLEEGLRLTALRDDRFSLVDSD
ncbi:MAG: NAD-dependent epimerase/dehydratase family protein [Anaerolineales bacterium]|nr:NAD-dependent epimerase/dehydratase family protein [Anaerolineales bacterium]